MIERAGEAQASPAFLCTWRGEIVIRRVNDVDGASDEQLRWHIESTTIDP